MMKRLFQKFEAHLQKKHDRYAIRPVKWCCDGFKYKFESRHQEGIFIYATPPLSEYGAPLFWIGMSAIPITDLKNLPKISTDPQTRIVLATSVPVTNCPWCGRNLGKFYLVRLAQVIDRQFIEEFMPEGKVQPGTTKNPKEPNQAL